MSYANAYAPIPGAVQGCIVNQTTHRDEYDARISDRSTGSSTAFYSATIDARPHSTKYTTFQVFDAPTPQSRNLAPVTTEQTQINPNAVRGQPAQFLRTVDLETQLQSRRILGDQNVYVPQKGSSDLYNVDEYGAQRWGGQHADTTLFQTDTFASSSQSAFVRSAPMYTGHAASRFFGASTSARNN